MEYTRIIRVLMEPSTWRGIVLLCTAFGITLSPETTDAIIQAGLSVAGLISIVFERGK